MVLNLAKLTKLILGIDYNLVARKYYLSRNKTFFDPFNISTITY